MPSSARQGRVLVIDDESAVGRTIQRLLGEFHHVVVMTHGQEALELLAQGVEFDVILCDLTMPDLSGSEVFSRAVEARADLAERFVFMTGGTFNPRAREFLDRVPNERIDKPFDLDTVRTLVRVRVAQRT